MRFNSVVRFRRLARFVSLAPFAILTTSLIFAQPNVPSSQPATAPTTTSAPTDSAPTAPTPTTSKAPEIPTVESIQSRIKLIQEQSGLDEGAKTKIIEIYNQAIADLGRAEEMNARIAEFQKQLHEAPGTIEEMTNVAAMPVPEPEIKPAPDVKLTDLEKQLAEAEAKLNTLSGRLASLDAELENRDARIKAIAEQSAVDRKELDEVTNALANPSIAEEPPERAAAKRIALLARAHSLGKVLDFQKLDLERTDFLVALRGYIAHETAKQEKATKAWQGVVNDRRRLEVEAAAETAKEAEKQAEKSHEVVASLARENSRLVAQRKEILTKIEQVADRKKAVESELKKVNERRKETATTNEIAGISQQQSMMLRRYRDQLPNVRELRRRLSITQQELEDLEDIIVITEEMKQSAKEPKVELRARLRLLEPDLPKNRRDAIAAEVESLLKARKRYVKDLLSDCNTYFQQLVGKEGGLVALHQQNLLKTEEFAAFINERIFWARSTTLPNARDFESGRDAFRWLTNPKNWRNTYKALVDSARINIVEASFAAFFLLLMILAQPRVRSSLRAKCDVVSKSYSAVFTPTVEAFFLTILAAMPLPVLLLTVGWFLNIPYDVDDFARAFAKSIQSVAFPIFFIEVLRQTCRPRGLGESHYQWPTKVVRLVGSSCRLLILVGTPLALVTFMVEWKSNDYWNRSLGRLAFCLGELLMTYVLWRVLRPKSGVLNEIPLIKSGGWRARLGFAFFASLVLTPISLAVVSIIGFQFTAIEIAFRFNRTLWFMFGLIIIYNLGLRWLLISRRKLAIEQARQRRAALEARQMENAENDAADKADASGADLQAPDVQPEPEIDISSLNDQTRAIMRAIAIVSFLLVFWAVWVDVIPALKIFDDIQLWSAKDSFSRTVTGDDGQPRIETGERLVWITLADLIVGLLYVVVTVTGVKNLPGLLEIGVYRRLSLGAGERYAMTTIVKYVITFFGVVFAFGAIGIGWAEVQWLAAAMTVGLGFGLQEIFANFVSGLILLFERPIRVGDTVTIGGVDGRVTRIQMRATTILNVDRKELIIPNKELITGQVVNWTLSDRVLRIVIDIGVAYGSDTTLVRELLLKIAAEYPEVLKDPAPSVLFKGFGASSLDFQLACFVEDISDAPSAGDTMRYQINDAFNKAGIEIAFPQLDIRVRDVPKEMLVRPS